MSKIRSLSCQVIHAISESATAGTSKRSYARGHDGSTGSNVYSISHYRGLSKTAKELCSWIHGEYPEIRRVRDIRPDILQAWLMHKAETCNTNTMRKLVSYVHKLDLICSNRYGGTWHSDRVTIPAIVPMTESQIRGKAATQTEYGMLLEAMRRGGRSESWKSLPLSRYAGLRVNETANIRYGRLVLTGGRWGCGLIVIQGSEDGAKGGRWRTVDILTLEARDALMQVCAGKKHGDYIIAKRYGSPLATGSVMKSLTRAIEKVGLNKDEWLYEGHHAFRRQFAQECYDSIRMEGGSQRDARAYTNAQLGHGFSRRDLLDRYVKNQW